jgi:hypothetical protein
MDDQDLEARLQGYRPAGPPRDLRARVVAARADGVRSRVPPGARHTLAWLPAAAAVLLATMFYWLAAAGRERVLTQLPAVPSSEAIELSVEPQP